MSTAKKGMETGEEPSRAFHAKQSLRIWLRLLSCSTRIEKSLQGRLKGEFQSTLPRFDVLSALERSETGMTMSELSAHLLVSNGNITGIVQRLVEEGLVVKAITKSDRRTQRVMLTPKGREFFSQMASEHEQWVDGMFAGLSSAELSALHDALGELKHSISQEEASFRAKTSAPS